MKHPHLVGNRGQVEAYLALCKKALGLPQRGEHRGGGRHVTIPDEPYDAHGKRNPGWTTEWDTPREHPKRPGLWATLILPGAAAAPGLSVAEAATAKAAEHAAVDLDETWAAVAEAEPLPRGGTLLS